MLRRTQRVKMAEERLSDPVCFSEFSAAHQRLSYLCHVFVFVCPASHIWRPFCRHPTEQRAEMADQSQFMKGQTFLNLFQYPNILNEEPGVLHGIELSCRVCALQHIMSHQRYLRSKTIESKETNLTGSFDKDKITESSDTPTPLNIRLYHSWPDCVL